MLCQFNSALVVFSRATSATFVLHAYFLIVTSMLLYYSSFEPLKGHTYVFHVESIANKAQEWFTAEESTIAGREHNLMEEENACRGREV